MITQTAKQRPILFSTPMVKAILEGRKTMTRRALKNELPIGSKWWQVYDGELIYRIVDSKTVLTHCRCPYGKTGDVLWVRETFCDYNDGYSKEMEHLKTPTPHWLYRADCKEFEGAKIWKPSLFMPKEAARVWLEITNVSVERLQDISEEDAKAEGITMNNKPHKGCYWMEDIYSTDSPTYAFECLWQSINGRESWDANPFVWVLSFKKIEKPRLTKTQLYGRD